MPHIPAVVRQQHIQHMVQREAAVTKTLLFSRKRFKKFEEIIFHLYREEDLSAFYTDRRIWKIAECFKNLQAARYAKEREQFKELLVYLSRHSRLVSDEEHIQAVYNIFLFRKNWRNDLYVWKPVSKQPFVQLKELTAFLFCKYPMPEFLHKAFYETKNTLFIKWYNHIGNGGRARDLENVPVVFTQKMAHYFLQAHYKFTVAEALRWAQVKGLGGTDALAERVAYSWIAQKPFGDEPFWFSFLQLLVNSGMFNCDMLTELVDYVREVKRENNQYSLKGRTLTSLLRQSDEWHKRFSKYKGNEIWKPSGIGGLRHQKKQVLILIEELTETAKLREEGRAMKHCVASYSFYCAKGRSAIFSIRKFCDGVLLDTLATIEVNLSLKRIVQAKAKMNNPINEEAKHYMQAWAAAEALSMSPYL
jgi:PcfJ-like protein